MNGNMTAGPHSDVESLHVLDATTAANKGWTLADLTYFERFGKVFIASHKLGEGSDGQVWACKLRTAKATQFKVADWIAVKFL